MLSVRPYINKPKLLDICSKVNFWLWTYFNFSCDCLCVNHFFKMLQNNQMKVVWKVSNLDMS